MTSMGQSQSIIAWAVLFVKIPETNGTNEKLVTQGFIFAHTKNTLSFYTP